MAPGSFVSRVFRSLSTLLSILVTSKFQIAVSHNRFFCLFEGIQPSIDIEQSALGHVKAEVWEKLSFPTLKLTITREDAKKPGRVFAFQPFDRTLELLFREVRRWEPPR